jgi:hypothetical protein
LPRFPESGKPSQPKIKELPATGSLKYFEDLRAEFPAAILELVLDSGAWREKD